MSGRIFISYRRSDVPGDARSLHDRLSTKFGRANVFMDVDNLFAGQRFDQELGKALATCNVLLVVIGSRWMELLAEHMRGETRDYVREEIRAALSRKVIVVPVLMGGEGRMPVLPRAQDLPEEIRDLVSYQKQSIAHESFGRDIDELIAAIERVLRAGHAPGRWKVPAAAAAVVAIAAVALAYWFGPSGLWRPTDRSSAMHEGGVKTEDPRALAERKAAEEAKKRAEAAALTLVTECDRLAASPYDYRPGGVMGLNFARIIAPAAITACADAMRHYPKVARFIFQAGRAAEASKDYDRAVDLYREAIEEGSVIAMAHLGFLYENGFGVTKSLDEARKWYEKAATRGNVEAMGYLAGLYENANDYDQARVWYGKAAERGFPDAISKLGSLHENGLGGLPKDLAQAERWYKKAREAFENDAKLGDIDAMVNLGKLYQEGRIGIAKDCAEARRWYERAAEAGAPDAKENLSKLTCDR